MNEKIAISDVLNDLNSCINACTYAIQQANNEAFRNTLITSRNNIETLEYEVYLLAKEKGYYTPAAPAGEADIEQVKNAISC